MLYRDGKKLKVCVLEYNDIMCVSEPMINVKTHIDLGARE